MTEKEYLDMLLPDWQKDAYYTDEMFNKQAKNKELKNIMSNLRIYYGKHSKRQAGCWCGRGIRLILEWLKNKNKEI